VRLALGAAEAVALPTPMTSAAMDVYKQVSEYDGGRFAGKDFS
jgi:3-hydroxyisobutyrate dehydrogenase-like beta-hydroxyacid dehydrogenase